MPMVIQWVGVSARGQVSRMSFRTMSWSRPVSDVSIAVTAADREEWVGITGTVEVVDDQEQAQADIAAMARRYHTRNPAQAEDLIKNRFQPQRRVSFRVTPTRIHDHLDGD